MFTLAERDIATIILDGSTILMLIGLTLYSKVFRRRGRPDDKMFMAMIIIIGIMSVSDAIGSIFELKSIPMAGRLAEFGWGTFYIEFFAFLITFAQYAKYRRASYDFNIKAWLAPVFIPGYIYCLLMPVTHFTKLIFWYDENRTFQMGIMFIPMYILFLIYLIMGFGNMAMEIREKNLKTAIPIWLFMIPIIVGVAIAFVMPTSASFAPFCLALTITFTYMGSLSELAVVYSIRS